MKKLILGAAAMVAGLVFADSEITSSNVVGYNQTPDTTDSMTMIGASFEGVDKNGQLLLSAIQSNEGLESGDQIQVAYTDDDGLTQFNVYEYDAADGWLDPDYEPCGDTYGIPVGKAVWFVPSGTPKTITTAGQVKSGNFIHTFTEELNLTTSAFPVPFCPNSEDISWGISSGDQIQVAYSDDDGITQFIVYEYDSADGWLDPDYNPLEADQAIVNAGIGFWLVLQDSTSTFSEASPL